MKLSVNRNLQIGFGFSLLLLIISSAASFISIQNLLSSSRMVNQTNTILLELENVISIMKDAETGQRGYLLTNDEDFLEPYTGAKVKSLQAVKRIQELTSNDADQLQNSLLLEKLILIRLDYLEKIIVEKKAGNGISVSALKLGKSHMDQIRNLVTKIWSNQNSKLDTETKEMNRFAGFTPLLILFAALLSIVISIFSYLKVNKDFAEKNKLQEDLLKKDEEISSRIDIIKSVAGDISEGNYNIRINDAQKDGLGSLALSLDKMATSLQTSFEKLKENEWLQTGIANLNEKMVGEKDLQTLTSQLVEFVAEYTQSQAAVIYLRENDQLLKFQSGYAYSPGSQKEFIQLGEGLIGQSALSHKPMLIKDISADDLSIHFSSGVLKPKNILAIPIFNGIKLKGVIELASVNEFTENMLHFLNLGSQNIGIAIATALIRKKQQELLEETQAQSEELQAQHSELENLNTELETQTQKIQASEEELKVQQEELLQNNHELGERSRLLEEKNQVIVERNLEIQQKAEQLELSTKYKSEFLANMSHELRTPLNSILLLSRMMSENKELDTEHVEYAEVIQSAGQGLLSLIDEILDLSKIESGKMELEYVTLTIEEVIKNMRSLFEPMMKQKDLELKIDVESSVPVSLLTDKMRLEQILKNLLSNALKFTSKGSITLKIWQNENKKLVHFSVIDTGIGISEDKQQLVFEAFQQADGSTRRRFGGTGLGLSISRELAKLLGGEIKLVSKPGAGSEFTVSVPVSKPVAEEIIAITKMPEPDVTPVTISSLEIKKAENFTVPVIPEEIQDDRNSLEEGDKIILIIEDDTLFAKALLDYTRKQGFKGIVRVRGDEGLPSAIQYQPLAILLDIQLPIKDGWMVMEELKANPKTRHIPVHIMSSMEMKKESLLKGAIDFINKPVALEQMNQIFNRIQEVISRNPKKVLIVEENPKHAKALGFFLSNFNINSEISESVSGGIGLLNKKEVDCVILDMGLPDKNGYEVLDRVKKSPGMEHLPIIVFTGKNLSKAEESRIKQYADSIVVKTAHSYQRILDEVGLFLHVVQDNNQDQISLKQQNLGALQEVLNNKTVLVADDDVRNIFSLTKALEKHGMNVISATDGKEALLKLQENPEIDIVLMDMMMPEMDGYESTRLIRKDPKFKNLPVLAVTAKAMMGDREKCIQAGASDYISKPVDIDQLSSLLRVWLYEAYKY
ncbi:response regulator [Daejeonella oryzae]|uniref:response regulator n=1 Tax=Daejeonella oryzae TaxID=1122943 RepID=UPI00040BC17C|nr:response regulator [Daejeonella oryzae]